MQKKVYAGRFCVVLYSESCQWQVCKYIYKNHIFHRRNGCDKIEKTKKIRLKYGCALRSRW